MKSPEQRLAIAYALAAREDLASYLRSSSGREAARDALHLLPEGELRSRLWRSLVEAELVCDEGM